MPRAYALCLRLAEQGSWCGLENATFRELVGVMV